MSAVVRLPLRWAGRGARGWLVGALGSGHAGVPVGSPSTGGAWSCGPAGVPVEGSCMARSHRALQRPLCQVSHTRQRPPGRRERTRHVEGGVTISNPAGNLKAVRPAGQSAASELSWAECARKRRPSASLRPPAVENAPGLSTCGNDSHVATRRVPATSRTAANQTHNHTQPHTTTHNHTQPHTTTQPHNARHRVEVLRLGCTLSSVDVVRVFKKFAFDAKVGGPGALADACSGIPLVVVHLHSVGECHQSCFRRVRGERHILVGQPRTQGGGRGDAGAVCPVT